MRTSTTDHWYGKLPLYELPIAELLNRPEHFRALPESWHILVTDIENSTAAIQRGLHEAVNLIGAGSIIAVLNIARREGLIIPFFFGGDGATLAVPPSLMSASIAALRTHRKRTQAHYKLNLRLGHFTVGELNAAGKPFRIARWRSDPSALVSPVVLGDGLLYAEDVIKGEPARQDIAGGGVLDLSGMQCKWDRIQAPEDRHEIVSLMVLVRQPDGHAEVYRQVLEALDAIYGPSPQRNPVNREGLNLLDNFRKLKQEMLVKYGDIRKPRLWKEWAMTAFAKYLYFPNTRAGAHYLQRMVELSEILVLDGSISTVISGNARQREQLTDHLEQLEQRGLLLFGFYISSESVVSCYVRDSLDDHIHFVDGAGGGYTKAAGMLKVKLRALRKEA